MKSAWAIGCARARGFRVVGFDWCADESWVSDVCWDARVLGAFCWFARRKRADAKHFWLNGWDIWLGVGNRISV